MAKRAKPTPDILAEDTHQLYEVLNNQTDLAIILISTSFIDAALASLLASKLRQGSTSDRLLGQAGLLGTIRAKADLCYCLELLPESWYNDIVVVSEIRNTVAHDHLHRDFDDPEMAALAMKLSPPTFGSEKSPRNRFRNVAVMLTNRIIMDAMSLKIDRDNARAISVKKKALPG